MLEGGGEGALTGPAVTFLLRYRTDDGEITEDNYVERQHPGGHEEGEDVDAVVGRLREVIKAIRREEDMQ